MRYWTKRDLLYDWGRGVTGDVRAERALIMSSGQCAFTTNPSAYGTYPIAEFGLWNGKLENQNLQAEAGDAEFAQLELPIGPDLPNKTLFRPDEVAVFFRISRSMVYRWCECMIDSGIDRRRQTADLRQNRQPRGKKGGEDGKKSRRLQVAVFLWWPLWR